MMDDGVASRDEFEGPAPDADGPATAGELFAHGLLTTLVTPGASAARENRIRRVLDAIGAEDASARRWRFPVFRGRALAAAAVLALVGVAATILLLGTEPAAHALIRHSIAALRAVGERQYRALTQDVEGGSAVLSTTIDSRSGGLILIRHRPPGADFELIAGRDEAGEWHQRHDGSISRAGGLPGVPRWASIGGASFLDDPLDVVLEALARSYTLTRLEPAPLPAKPDRVFSRVLAQRSGRGGGDARRIEIWIDPETRVPERIDISEFPAPPGGVPRRGDPLPPARVVIERVDAAPLPADWFSPARWAW